MLLVGGIVGLIAGWYFSLGILTWVLFFGGIMGAAYALQLGNWAKSRSERDGGGSSGL
jgi:phosphate/sulfate permease